VRYCANKDRYILVWCDYNTHHSVWDSTNCHSRGKALVEFLNSTNFYILNWGNELSFCGGGRLVVIGIMLGLLRLLESIIEW
jgi:hypothetical protein